MPSKSFLQKKRFKGFWKSAAFASMFCVSSCDLEKKDPPTESFEDSYLFFDMTTEVSEVPCEVQGTVPLWLHGTLYRNGPAKFQVEKKRVDWFDGLAMLHAISFQEGKVGYTNRFLRSCQYDLMMEQKTLNFSGFGQKNKDPSFLKKVPLSMQEIENANVSIQQYAKQIVALTEVPFPVLVDPNLLDTLGVFQYEDSLVQGQWESAHPLKDPFSQETINYAVHFARKSSYVVWKMPEGSSARELIAEIPVDRPSYMHSFALTENYVVLAQVPFLVDPLDLLLQKKPFIFNYQWEPEKGTDFLIIDRGSGNFKQIKGPSFFAFHHTNAFEKEGKLILDMVTYPNADVIAEVTQKISQGLKEGRPALQRFTIDLSTSSWTKEALFDQEVEFPRIPDHLVGREYRCCYAVDIAFPQTLKDSPSLYKIDVIQKTAKAWSQEGCFPGEPIFVPHPEAKMEDEGVVLSLVLDFAEKQSFVLILNSLDFSEQARIVLPHAIPVGLHGLWESGKEKKK